MLIFCVEISQVVKGDRADRQILPQQFPPLLPARFFLRIVANFGRWARAFPQHRHHSHWRQGQLHKDCLRGRRARGQGDLHGRDSEIFVRRGGVAGVAGAAGEAGWEGRAVLGLSSQFEREQRAVADPAVRLDKGEVSGGGRGRGLPRAHAQSRRIQEDGQPGGQPSGPVLRLGVREAGLGDSLLPLHRKAEQSGVQDRQPAGLHAAAFRQGAVQGEVVRGQ